MLRMCVYMHSRFIENHLIWILEDGPLISKVVLLQDGSGGRPVQMPSVAVLLPSSKQLCRLHTFKVRGHQ
jgi:hypothetical protein